MTHADVPGVVEIPRAAFSALGPVAGAPPAPPAPPPSPGRIRQAHRLIDSDPDGQWVAEAPDGSVVGVASAIRREGLWGLSLLAVLPSWQGAGLGRRLLDAAITTAAGATGALIVSSHDPRALRRYASAGFALDPTFEAVGALRRGAVVPPDGVREGGADDLPLTEDVDRAVRGAPHGRDLAAWLDDGARLFVAEAGYALTSGDRVSLLAATDPPTAAAVLRAALRGFEDGARVEVFHITGAQQWALPVLLAAGLALLPSGALCSRGALGPLSPYLPSGAFL